MKTRAPSYELRPYEDGDERAVLDLLNTSLGGGPAGARPAEFFRWKHLESPFGRSFMIVADAGDALVGLRAFMRWEFRAGERALRGVRAVDTATHPAYQGLGIFSRLTRRALELLADEADFVFNTPNEKSLPGYLKMGWNVVASVPIAIRVCRPLRFALRAAGVTGAHRTIGEDGRAGARDGGIPSRVPLPAAEAIEEVPEDRLGLPAGAGARIATVRSRDYLRWRYGSAPLLDYRAVTTDEGIAIFRVRPRGRLAEATVSEVLAPDAPAAGRLLRAVRRAAGADHLAAHFASGTPARAALRRAGFVRAPRGMTFVARPLREGIIPDPRAFENWSLAIGDLEVF